MFPLLPIVTKMEMSTRLYPLAILNETFLLLYPKINGGDMEEAKNKSVGPFFRGQKQKQLSHYEVTSSESRVGDHVSLNEEAKITFFSFFG